MAPVRIFHLVSDFGPSAAARQLGLLADALPPDRFRVTVQPVRLRHGLDLRGLRDLRRAVAAAEPDVLHAWGPAAVRAARLLAGPRLVASAAEPPAGLAGWLTGRVLCRANRVVTSTRAEGDRLHRLGVPSARLTLIHPGVAPAPPPPDRAVFLQELGLPPDARLVMTAGRLDAGLRPAIWAFDVLRYEFRNLHLLAFGDGPGRADLERFGRGVAGDDYRVRLPGPRADLPAVLGLAEVVWVLQGRGGLNLALEAMAAGRPVVGWRTPDLAEVVEDGVTGLLADPREKARAAARSHQLLSDPAAADAMGAAGRARAADHFAVSRLADQYARVYAELAGGHHADRGPA